MTEGRSARIGIRVLGGLSIVLFFIPLLAPLVQIATLLWVSWAAWRGRLDRTTLVIGTAGAVVGLALFLATELVWIV